MMITLICSNPSISIESIVFIDMNKVLYESKVGKSIINQLNKKEKQLTKKFDNLKKDIQDKEKNIINKKNIISNEEFNKGINAVKLEINEFNKESRKNSNDLQNLRIKSTETFFKALNPILLKYSVDNSISMIIQKKNLVIGKSELDVTDKVIGVIDITMSEITIK